MSPGETNRCHDIARLPLLQSLFETYSLKLFDLEAHTPTHAHTHTHTHKSKYTHPQTASFLVKCVHFLVSLLVVEIVPWKPFIFSMPWCHPWGLRCPRRSSDLLGETRYSVLTVFSIVNLYKRVSWDSTSPSLGWPSGGLISCGFIRSPVPADYKTHNHFMQY